MKALLLGIMDGSNKKGHKENGVTTLKNGVEAACKN